MDIYTNINKSYDPREIETTKVVEEFIKNRKRQGELTPKEQAHLSNVLNLVEYINTIILTDHILHLSNDDELAEIIGCSSHAAKRAKNKLRKLGFIYVPAWARQKKEGDHPIWLVWFLFTKKVEKIKKNRKTRKKNFVQQYYTLLTQAKKNIRDFFEQDEKEFGITTSLHISQYMSMVHSELTHILKIKGLTRADLRI